MSIYHSSPGESRQSIAELDLISALGAAANGVWEWDVSRNQMRFSEAWSESFEYGQDQLPMDREAWQALIHPQDRIATVRSLELHLRGETSAHQCVNRLRTGAGNYRSILQRAYVVERDAEGAAVRVVGTDLDLSDHDLDRVPDADMAQLELGVDVANVGLGRVDYTTGVFELTERAARIYGLGDQALQCTRDELHDTFHPGDRDWLMEDISDFLSPEGDGRMSCQHRIIHPNGTERWVEVRKQVFFDRSGDRVSPLYSILAARDITDQKAIEVGLKDAKRNADAENESKSNFLANMSHEIRTPMTAILGYTDLAIQKVDDPNVITQLQTIRRNGNFLLEIINDILNLSKIEAGKLEISKEVFQPIRLIHDVVSIMNVRAIEKGLELSCQIAPSIPKYMRSDAKRLKQILVNLVGNAIKFTSQGSVLIQVELRPVEASSGNAGKLAVTVTDTGIGLSDEQRDHLFEPFEQGDSSITRDYGGTGLGLAISQRLAKMLGGRIECQSRQDVGSSFTCLVDVGEVDEAMIEPTEKSPDTTADPPEDTGFLVGRRVLVADDRRDIRFLTAHLLSKVGAEVEDAADGLEALELIRASSDLDRSYDLIVLDMQMPRLDGYQVAQRLRESGNRTPIIALTAEAMDGDEQRCLESGCDAYASKPIDAKNFLALVRRYVSPK